MESELEGMETVVVQPLQDPGAAIRVPLVITPLVINGASDLFVEIFGNKGKHARFAVCAHCLPRNAAVEVDGIFEIR